MLSLTRFPIHAAVPVSRGTNALIDPLVERWTEGQLGGHTTCGHTDGQSELNLIRCLQKENWTYTLTDRHLIILFYMGKIAYAPTGPGRLACHK